MPIQVFPDTIQKNTMKPSMKIQTSISAFDQDSIDRRFSKQQKKSLVLSSHYQHQHNKSDACKSNQSNNTVLPFTPPPSPSPKNKLRYSQRNYIKNRPKIEILADELIDMFEQAVQQCIAAENRYKRLDLATKFTLNLQTKTYEYCINELNKKIERLEAQSSPRSSIGSDFLSSLIEGYTIDPKEVLHSDNTEDHANEPSSTPNQESQTEALKQQIVVTEQSMQQIIANYVSTLEKERLQTKRLNAIIAKQDNLISTLEAKLKEISNQQNNNNDDDGGDTTVQMTFTPSKHEKLLEAQVELQGLELEDKERLLSMLLDERDKLCIKVDQLSHLKPLQLRKNDENNTDSENHSKKRSTIDILAKIVRSDIPSPVPDSDVSSATLSLKKPHLFNNHSPPPPSRPPKNPLPPTPFSTFEQSKPSISAQKSQKLSVDQHQSVDKSPSYLDLEEAKDTNASYCYIPYSSEREKPVYQHAQGSHEWRKHLVQDLTIRPDKKIIEQPAIDINHHTNGFSSLLKGWRNM